MGTFTISQSKSHIKAYIYPNADLSGCTNWSVGGDDLPFGIENYECINEVILDTDKYVLTTSTTYVNDLYGLQNTTTNGTINYIKEYAVLKSSFTPNQDVHAYLICSPNSVCTDYHASDEKALTNGWKVNSHIWTENPSTSSSWTWGELDSLSLGIRGKSANVQGSGEYTILRPNGDGGLNTFTPIGDSPNWKCVDEAVSDGDTTCVQQTIGTTKTDEYALEYNSILDSATITNVTVFINIRARNVYAYNPWYTIIIKTGGTQYNAGYWLDAGDTSYKLKSHSWSTNPNTGNAWTPAEIQSLIAGVKAPGNETDIVRITQLYVKIDYTLPITPTVQMAQCYLEIDYIPPPDTCTLTKPEVVSMNHARNIKMLNFWNGSREVYDLNRSGKSLLLKGMEYENSGCSRIECMRDMADDGALVTLAGFSFEPFNGEYRIRSFGWDRISKKPDAWKWILELEDSTAKETCS